MEEAGQFDYVVVGAGSAGCVVAARLSESGTYRVALIEAGGEDKCFWIRAPLGYGKLYDDPTYNWRYESEPEPELAGARMYQPRGKVLGGTGSINGMVYMRGQREDFDHWRDLGNVGWSYSEVLPYFKKSEDNDRGEDAYHRVGGPLRVSNLPPHELADAFIAAGQQLGYVRNDDINGASQEGFGYHQVTIRDGRRVSTATAYLRPARTRPCLHVITQAQALHIEFRAGRATGVKISQGGVNRMVRASREVIICGGVFNSPQLLQLSGIGPGELLSKHNIPPVVDLPGVGENLHDHFTVGTIYRCTKPVTLNDAINNPFRRWSMALEYLIFGSGLMTTNANYCGGCIRTESSQLAPEVRLRLRTWGRSVTGRAKRGMGLHPFSSFEIALALSHPEGRGYVRIKDNLPATPPSIFFNFFASGQDQRNLIAGLRVIKQLAATSALAPYIAEELLPGPGCNSDAQLLAFGRQRGRSNNHAVGTCKMGVGTNAVVDSRLRVHGIDGLRVVDASIMPRIVGADTNATTVMIGEKGAAMILEDAH